MCKLTQAEFIRTMQTSRNGIVAVLVDEPPLSVSEMFRRAKKIACDREVAETRSNCLIFTDGSRMFFKGYGKRTYKQFDNVIEVSISESGDQITSYVYYVFDGNTSELRKQKQDAREE